MKPDGEHTDARFGKSRTRLGRAVKTAAHGVGGAGILDNLRGRIESRRKPPENFQPPATPAGRRAVASRRGPSWISYGNYSREPSQ